MFFVKLLLVELKLFAKSLPKLASGAAALCVSAAVLTAAAVGISGKTAAVNKANIMLVMPEEDNYISFAADMLKNMESTASLCIFTQTNSENAAVSAVENGTAYAAVVFPNNFVSDIVHGKNTPAKIILSQNSSLDNALFRDLAEGGCGMFAAVQSGIYAVQNAYSRQTGKELDKNTLNALNMTYITFVLSREKYYYNIPASLTGDVSPLNYYTAMFAAVVLLLLGMSAGQFLSEKDEFSKTVKYKCRCSCPYVLAKQLCFFVFCTAVSAAACAAAAYLGADINMNIMHILPAVWLCSAAVTLVCRLCGSSGALVIFVLAAALGFWGGAFLPVSLLPHVLAETAAYSPVNAMAQCFMGGSVKICAVYAAVTQALLVFSD